MTRAQRTTITVVLATAGVASLVLGVLIFGHAGSYPEPGDVARSEPVTTTTVAPTTSTTSTTSTTTTVAPTTSTTVVPATAPAAAVESVHAGSCGGYGALMAQYFPGEEGTACRVFIGCESGGNPNAVSATGDHGLAQINAATWNKPGHADPVADWIGRHWSQVYDPAVNLAMASKIRAAYGWQMWACF